MDIAPAQNPVVIKIKAEVPVRLPDIGLSGHKEIVDRDDEFIHPSDIVQLIPDRPEFAPVGVQKKEQTAGALQLWDNSFQEPLGTLIDQGDIAIGGEVFGGALIGHLIQVHGPQFVF